MAYAVQSDLLLRITAQELVQLTDDDKTGEVNLDTMQGCLDKATGIIDSYVRDRYKTPLQTSNTATQLCVDMAVYELYSRRPQRMNETVRQRYADAVSVLKDISAGKASLDQPAGALIPQTSTGGPVRPAGSHLRFSEHNIDGFV